MKRMISDRIEVLQPGHGYRIAHIPADPKSGLSDPEGYQDIQFVVRFRGDQNRSGILIQDLIRIILDRLPFLNKEVPWEGNKEIMAHLRQALLLFECRALLRKVEKGEWTPEELATGPDGHLLLTHVTSRINGLYKSEYDTDGTYSPLTKPEGGTP